MKSLCLISWRDLEGRQQKFRLVNKVSSQWREIGLLVGIDQNQLDGWWQECQACATRCWNKVMSHWLDSGCEYPITWEGLFALLEDLGMKQVASELKMAVCLVVIPTAPSVTQATTATSEFKIFGGEPLELCMGRNLHPVFAALYSPLLLPRLTTPSLLLLRMYREGPLPFCFSHLLLCPTPSTLLVSKAVLHTLNLTSHDID